MLFMKRLEFSCFLDFFLKIIKTSVEYGFLYNEGTVNSMGKRLKSSVKMMSPGTTMMMGKH